MMPDTHTYTHSCPPLILRVHEHTHICCAPFTTLPGVLPLHTHTHTHAHTHTAVYWRFGWWWHKHTHLYPCARLIACTNTYFFFTFTDAFFSHACGDTRNLRTYFTSVRRVFVVETVVLQTVLWEIRAWSARFLLLVGFIKRKAFSVT